MAADIFYCHAWWGVIHMWWAEAGDAPHTPQWTEHSPQERITKMSIAPRLRDLVQVQPSTQDNESTL